MAWRSPLDHFWTRARLLARLQADRRTGSLALSDHLRGHVLASLGLASPLLLACGLPVNVGDGTSDGGVTTDPSGDGSSVGDDGEGDGTSGGPNPTTGTTGPDTGTSTTGPDPDDGEDDGGTKFDLPPQPDVPALGDCSVHYTEPATLAEYPECPIVLDDGICSSNLYWGCVDADPNQTCEAQCPGGDCIAQWWNCQGEIIEDSPAELCGPYLIDGMCCTLAEIVDFCGTDGRPFVIDGVARQAELLASASNVRAAPRLPARVREHLAAHWATVARAEHASIASFAQFAARLLALGAPAALVRDALAAARDEVRHAALTLDIAGEFGGRALAFGALDTRGAANPSESFAQTVLACVREGCIGETLAALELATAALHCSHSDPELAARLRAVADDETRHAALAWRFVQWALIQSPSLAVEVAALFESLDVPALATERSFDRHEQELLFAHGCLPAGERRRVEVSGLQQLIRPCAQALLEHTAAHHAC